VVKVYNVENQSQLNIDQLNKLQNVVVRVKKNFHLNKQQNIIFKNQYFHIRLIPNLQGYDAIGFSIRYSFVRVCNSC
jgi:hypothetical protein